MGAHPRSRGENPSTGGETVGNNGSSPLTRGKHVAGLARGLPRGLIPAHAGKTVSSRNSSNSARAHPRSRGENFCGCSAPDADWGSSPLTRGKLASASQSIGCSGLIPAHAGKTIARCWVLRYRGAHPRSRGENGAVAVGPIFPHGSSPLTRGKRSCTSGSCRGVRLIPAHAGKTGDAEAQVDLRRGSSPLTRGKPEGPAAGAGPGGLIPAHAGKTDSHPLPPQPRWAHPRSRGENSTGEYFGATSLGSSPLTRGKLGNGGVLLRQAGLIPAHAGKTVIGTFVAGFKTAHPRSRGENIITAVIGVLSQGSSPLTRGKHHADRRADRAGGLIPAHAGKTLGPLVAGCEHKGSSPLTRGKHPRAGPGAARAGLIPAHAGKTQPPTVRGRCRGAHPRSRGENRYAQVRATLTGGSSPLTRGKRPLVANRRTGEGLIPAHAGKTAVRRIEQNQEGAHPRSRGENAVMNHPAAAALGSSPLTRGKPTKPPEELDGRGLIPAHAGKTHS